MTQLTQQSRETETQIPERRASATSHAARAVAIALLVLLVAGGFSVARRLSEHKALAKETERLSVPAVSLIRPSAEPAHDDLVLPAQLQAYVESAIYSRTNGYLLRWYKDIGSHVKKGELLAEIDTPEVDQELSQAKATRQQILAQLELAKISADRWANLRKTDSVSQQEADQQSSAYTQAQANLAAADANVRRLEQLESFKHIYAPFSGVITRRNTDLGMLINAGSAAQAKELFDLAQFDPLRVYISVPQTDALSVRAGMSAYIELNEYPGQKFIGKVVRTADSIDPATRTMLTEVDVPNHDGRLMPGAYAQLHFAVPVQAARISVPVNTVLFRPEGPQVAVVGDDQKIHLKVVKIGRDFGNKLEILGGLSASDQIVVNPADSLEDGQQVHVKTGSGT
ncbi:MAG TPA: efflux RND transporter periplasmic adaptor subunit [Candidatus Angelobacter sp.]